MVARRGGFDGHDRRDHRLRRVCGHRRSCIVRDVERVARAGNRFLARLRCVNLRASRRDVHGGEVWRPSWTGLVKACRRRALRRGEKLPLSLEASGKAAAGLQ